MSRTQFNVPGTHFLCPGLIFCVHDTNVFWTQKCVLNTHEVKNSMLAQVKMDKKSVLLARSKMNSFVSQLNSRHKDHVAKK